MKSESEAAKGGKKEEYGDWGTFAAAVHSHSPCFVIFFFFLLSLAWGARIRLSISGPSRVASFKWMPQLNGALL